MSKPTILQIWHSPRRSQEEGLLLLDKKGKKHDQICAGMLWAVAVAHLAVAVAQLLSEGGLIFENASRVPFDAVVSSLLRLEIRNAGAALARHLRPTLEGRGEVWEARRRDALDGVSMPIAVMMQSLDDAGVDVTRARWLDITIATGAGEGRQHATASSEPAGAAVAALRLVRDAGWDEDARELARAEAARRARAKTDNMAMLVEHEHGEAACLTAGRMGALLLQAQRAMLERKAVST